jgi:RsiW-degrading membrane proteinase PrsW (M82 family)
MKFLVVGVAAISLMVLGYAIIHQNEIQPLIETSFYALEIIGGMMALVALLIIVKTLIQGRQSY